MRKILLSVSIIILLYTRLVALNWGLPYPMHPDERNMVSAIQQLNCELPTINYKLLTECFNPHFFAYGQLPLYLAYGVVGIVKFFDGDLGTPIGFQEATMALRMISAIASIVNVFVLIKLIQLLISKVKDQRSKIQVKNQMFGTLNFLLSPLTFAFCLLTFSPYAIQFSHFGTTESLLMLFYSLIAYLSLKLLSTTNYKLSTINYSLVLFSGLAIATKVSSVIFLAVPMGILISNMFFLRVGSPPTHSGGGFPLRQKKYIAAIFSVDFIINIFKFLIVAITISIIFSPHNIISFPDFISSINYESSVALGSYVVFYTRQFVGTIPAIFQLTKIFPYALGWPQYILAILGFFLLSWKNKYINLLRFALLVYFIPTSFMFAKWSRFMAPIFPIMSLFALLFCIEISSKFKIQSSKLQFKIKNFNFSLQLLTFNFALLTCIIPGLAYLSIYQNPDVRFEASQWIYQNIPAGSKILSETANVVDIPIQPPHNVRTGFKPVPTNYQLASFNFYDLDENPALPVQLDQLIEGADYIIVPSRRIFANHKKEEYPLLNNYYDKLFSGSLGFEKVAEFSSFPRLSFQISNFKFQIPFPDESAEETWTVFDHPVIRIYKKSSIPNNQYPISNNQTLNLKNYQTINYKLQTTNYKLLLADNPEKWETGLMYVRNKKDIGGLDGMLFQFPDKKMRTFWNKNTVSNLDLYWIDGDKIVGISKLPAIGKSGETTTVSSSKAVDKVVELFY